MNAFSAGIKAVLLAMVLRVLTVASVVSLNWLTAKGWLGTWITQADTLSFMGLIYLAVAGLVGAGLDWLLTRNFVSWLASMAQQAQDGGIKTPDIAGKLPMLLLALISLSLAACSQTPSARYQRAALVQDGAAIGVPALHAGHKIDDATYTRLMGKIAAVGDKLREAHQWLSDNPGLADVPYAPCPPLDAVRAQVLDLLPWRIYAANLVPLSAPTTAPK